MSINNTWYAKSFTEIFKEFDSGEGGLTSLQALQRLEKQGLNKLPDAKVDGLGIIFLRQFESPLIYILVAASIMVFIMGEIVDGGIILAVLLFNAVMGTIQEGKAQNTLLALKRFVETKATVIRDDKELIIPDTEVVPGDIIILREGEKIPADARMLLARNMKVDEAVLSGESEPARKSGETLHHADLSLLTQSNLVFKGTHVVSGNGKAIVIATGNDTAMGRIAAEIATVDTEIPLKVNIRALSRLIIIIVTLMSAVLFVVGIISGKSAQEMFGTVVSLSVSVIPEGLPIVMTLVLATGVWRMSKRNVLVKKLHAVESLGQARIIAVDKTGTLTKNEMVIQKVYVDRNFFEIGGVGYEPSGSVHLRGAVIDPANHPELLHAGKIAAFCANARVSFVPFSSEWHVAGDPTEAAMLVLSQKLGFHKDSLEQESPLLIDIPFDYKLKYHAAVHEVHNERFLTVVGAAEEVLALSVKIWRGGENHSFSAGEKQELESIFLAMSGEGLRVVALAEHRGVPEDLMVKDLTGLTFVGFFGMKDALRSEVSEAMREAVAAGIRVVMITGDHRVTAQAIATEAGIYRAGDLILTGVDIDAFSETELAQKLSFVSVFARVSPEHKLRIVEAYKARGEVVAMTGDGVNDAPSLLAADLGVAMGKIGTEVAKEAADIVLLDDNFGSIIAAVEEGRSIYKTIKKVILYLFATSAGEVLAIAGALVLGYPLLILPAQIIWLNLVTDGFLDVALAMEPKEKGLLRGNFERPGKYFVDKLMGERMILMSVVMAIGALYLFNTGNFETDLPKAMTISLTGLAVFQWFNVWNCRSEDRSLFDMNPFSNMFLVGATFVVISLQLLAVYHPIMQKLLHTVPLAVSDWLLIVPVAASIVLAEEIRKFFYRRRT
jgi:Ca2+-transporting ATPase